MFHLTEGGIALRAVGLGFTPQRARRHALGGARDGAAGVSFFTATMPPRAALVHPRTTIDTPCISNCARCVVIGMPCILVCARRLATGMRCAAICMRCFLMCMRRMRVCARCICVCARRILVCARCILVCARGFVRRAQNFVIAHPWFLASPGRFWAQSRHFLLVLRAVAYPISTFLVALWLQASSASLPSPKFQMQANVLRWS